MLGILNKVQSIVRRGLWTLGATMSRLAKPMAYSHVPGTILDLARSKPQLLGENLLLRQQLLVLNRSVKRPHVTAADRGLFVLLASRVQH